ncbi:MAG: translocation/assembly module TamB domain-containing protein [Halobacteriovoraceae bacterium]|nr:translocation/assembly module TamB domain-containing protein [Halobacteriovoraceae bacterium]
MKFTQTEYFSSILSREITRAIKKIASAKLEFERISVNVFPPATILENVRFEYQNQKILQVNELSIEIDIFDLFYSDLAIKKIKMSDGQILMLNSLHEKKIEFNENMLSEFDAFRNKLYNGKNVKIMGIELNDIGLYKDELHAFVKFASLNLKKHTTTLEIESEDIHINEHKIDYFELKAQTYKNKVWIKKLNISDDLNFVSTKGEIEEENGHKVNFEIQGDVNIENSLLKRFKIDKEIYGELDFKANVMGRLGELEIKTDLNLRNVRTPWFYGDSLSTSVRILDEIVYLDSFILKNENGMIKTEDKIKFFNISQNKFIDKKYFIKANNMDLKPLIYSFRDSIDFISGQLSGNIFVNFEEDFKIDLKESIIKDFYLGKNVQRPIIINNELKVQGGILNWNWQNKLDLQYEIRMGEYTNLLLKGMINNKVAEFSIKEGLIDFKEFGPIAGVDIEGRGGVDFKMILDSRNYLDMYFTVNQFSVVGLNLGDAITHMQYDLDKNELNILDYKGKKEISEYEGKGKLIFGKNARMDLGINVKKSNLEDALDIFQNMKDKFTGLGNILNSEFKTNLRISGGYKLSEMSISGFMYSDRSNILNHKIDQLSLNYELEKEIISLKNITLQKEQGQFKANILYNLKTTYCEYESDISKFKLQDLELFKNFDFGIDGQMNGSVYGSGLLKDHSVRGELKLEETQIAREKIPDSNILFFYDRNILNSEMSIFGKDIRVSMNIDLSELILGKKRHPSEIEIDFNVDDGKYLFGIFTERNMEINGPELNLKSTIKLSSYLKNFRDTNFSFHIDKFSFAYEDSYFSLNNELVTKIENGEVKKSNFSVSDGTEYLRSISKGDLNKDFQFKTLFSFNSKYLNLLSKKIKYSKGDISGYFVFLGNQEKFDINAEIISKKMNISLSSVFGEFKNTSFNILFNNGDIFLQSIKADYEGGEINGSGNIALKFPYPTLSLDFNIENVALKILERSRFVFNSTLSLSGIKPPYLVKSDTNITYGIFQDDLNNFSGGKINDSNRYLPDKKNIRTNELIELNSNIYITSPIRLKSNFLDFFITGELKLEGGIHDMMYRTKLNIVPTNSKIKFKGYDFVVTKGEVFKDEIDKSIPEINLSSTSEVSEYVVVANLKGPVNDTKLELFSEPALGQEDILSLLTLGYTTEMSAKINKSALTSVTRLGIGSILVDQLKINEQLNESFGIKLSVVPEFVDETNLVSTTSNTNNSDNKLKTTTKIQIDKPINKKLGLSFSSTVGGNLQEKQEVKLKYNLNKNISLQGIYELKSNDTDSNDGSINSLGGDLKFKWTFE